MAERRMIAKKVTDDDEFTALSSSAQALYMHLLLAADDDGFTRQVSLAMFKAHAGVSDLETLLTKRYIYQFQNGVIVILHWRMANALRKDRYTPTLFQSELAQLELNKDGIYITPDEQQNNAWLPDGCRVVANCLPQDRLGKDRKGKDSLGEDNSDELSLPAKTPKHKYGEYKNVLLTDDEYSKLCTEFPDIAERIERLSSYIASKGTAYKSHYATIRNWARKDKEQAETPYVNPKAKELEEFYKMSQEWANEHE